MSNRERIEIVGIVIFICGLYFYAEGLVQQVSLAKLLIWCSGLLLLQGLIRDLCILAFSRNENKQNPANTEQNEQIKIPCMCIESTLGILGIIIGSMLLFLTAEIAIHMSNHGWWLLLSAVLIVGFLIKDYVLKWSPWKISKEKNHINVVFTFKK